MSDLNLGSKERGPGNSRHFERDLLTVNPRTDVVVPRGTNVDRFER